MSAVIDPQGLTDAQRAGLACVYCHKRYPRPNVFVGCLPDGTPVFACDDHNLPSSQNGDH